MRRQPSYSGNLLRIALKFDTASSLALKTLLEKFAPAGHTPAEHHLSRLLLFTKLPSSQRPACEELLSSVASLQSPFSDRVLPALLSRRVRSTTFKYIYLSTSAPELKKILEKVRPYLGHEWMREERKELGLKEMEANWQRKLSVICFERLEREMADRVTEEMKEAFSSEEVRLNVIGLTLRERAVHEPDAEKEDVSDMEF